MKQREVTDEGSTKWTCVQAYSDAEGIAAEKAKALSINDEGKVDVVCTPRGGAQSVRLTLNKNWMEQLKKEELLKLIAEQHHQ